MHLSVPASSVAAFHGLNMYYTHIYMDLYVCMYVCMCVCVYMYVCMYIFMWGANRIESTRLIFTLRADQCTFSVCLVALLLILG